MNATMSHPGKMTVSPEHVSAGRTMVHVGEKGGEFNALLLWIDPATAAQWIKALTPIAEARP